MFRAWIGALVLVGAGGGCYAPSPAGGLPCSPTGGCPAGQTCSPDGICGGVVDAAGAPDADPLAPDAGPDDRDHDGVLDGDDNCPEHANPTQHDEDGDARGDECDPCPHLDGAADDDGDGDGVGVGCDPDDTVACHRLLFFDSFEAEDPAWTYGAGALHDGKLDLLGAALRDLPDDDAVTFGALMTFDGSAQLRLSQAASSAYECNLTGDAGQMQLSRVVDPLTQVLELGDALPGPQLAHVRRVDDPAGGATDLVCDFRVADNSDGVKITTTDFDPLPQGDVRISSGGVTVVDYAFAYACD
jgi:hypothetical protein